MVGLADGEINGRIEGPEDGRTYPLVVAHKVKGDLTSIISVK